jgi:RimJ/RimL family protein N-acetyltransferase
MRAPPMDDPAAVLPRFMLDDGRTICVRRLRTSDRTKYESAVAGLSARARYLRFAAPITSISGPLLDQMMCVDDARHVAYAALTPDETRIVGVARFVVGDSPGVAEVAIAIADDLQGHGLGFELLEWVLEHARAAGLERLVATSLSEDRRAGRLARAIGFSVAGRAGIYTEYDMPLGQVRPAGGLHAELDRPLKLISPTNPCVTAQTSPQRSDEIPRTSPSGVGKP